MSSRSPGPRNIFPIGTHLGSVEIRALLSQGPRGQLFLGRDAGLARDVVVKATWPGVDFAPLREEARVLAAFQHAGLPAVHGIGSHGGVDYVVGERVSGVSLAAHLLKRAPASGFSLPETLDVLVALCDTLAVLHGAALAHGDVRPENIVLAGGARVVLAEIDRGYQDRVVHEPDAYAPASTSDGDEVHEARLRDIYAVGVIAFEMLTGVLPAPHEPIAV